MARTIDIKQFRNFSVQIKSNEEWRNDLQDGLYTNWANAHHRAVAFHNAGLTTRIIGNHATAKGGCGNKLVWDSREKL